MVSATPPGTAVALSSVMTRITAFLLELDTSHNRSIEAEGWSTMKRFFVAATAVALLAPTFAFAQVTTVYIPGAHPRVVVVQPEKQTPSRKVEKAPLTPAQIIARHEAMAAAYRSHPRVNYSAVAHCDREVAKARAALRRNF